MVNNSFLHRKINWCASGCLGRKNENLSFGNEKNSVQPDKQAPEQVTMP